MTVQPEFDPADIPMAESWATSVTDDLERSNKRAWTIAIIAALIALLEAVALVVLLPLKTVEPYTILVDRQTGNVETLAPLDESIVTPDAALTRSMLVQYVTAREGFLQDTLQRDYRKVGLMSDNTVRQQYARTMDASNPASPLAYLPRRAVISTQIKSVSNLDGNRAMVRYTTTRADPGAAPQVSQHWVSVIGYQFVAAEMSEADRYLNPIGFQVTSYRRDAETLPKEGIVNGIEAPAAVQASE